MSEFATDQPKPGDTILHCGHMNLPKQHFWYIQQPSCLRFRRPDGSEGSANWLACCNPCFVKCGGDPDKLEIRGDGTWHGDEPAIKEPEKQ